MTEAPQQQATEYAHILDDLHGICRELAAVRAMLEGFALRLDQLDELLPAARRAAAMLDTPVTAWMQARKEARANGQDLQRPGTRNPRTRGSRPARRQLPDA